MLGEIRLIMHPGMPKCASSSIQTALINNRSRFAQHGKFVLDKNLQIREQTTKENPHGIPYAIIHDVIDGKVNIEEQLTTTCDYIRRKYKVSKFDLILSSELLSFINTERGQIFHSKLANLFSETHVHIVIRAPWKQLLSNWRQGGYRDGSGLTEYLDKTIEPERTLNYWESRIDYFRYFYCNVNVVSLDAHKDIVTYFLNKILRVSDGFVIPKSKSNPSLSPALCEILATAPHLFESELKDIRNVIKRHKNVLAAVLNPAAKSGKIFSNIAYVKHQEAVIRLRDQYIDSYIESLLKGGYSEAELTLLKEGLANEPIFNSEELINEQDSDELSNFSESLLLELVQALIADAENRPGSE